MSIWLLMLLALALTVAVGWWRAMRRSPLDLVNDEMARHARDRVRRRP